LAVAAARPGPQLTNVLYALADHFDDAHPPHVLTLLAPMSVLDDKRTALLRRARIGEVVIALDADAQDMANRIASLRERYPLQPVVALLEARHILATQGGAAAGRFTLEALRRLSANDIVYRKAVFHYAGLPLDAWDRLEPTPCYAYLRVALDTFRDDNYRAGVFRGGSSLDDDPFYDAFYETFSQLSPAQVAELHAGWRAELVFAGESRDMPHEILAQHIDPKRWQISFAIVQRLAAGGGVEPWRTEAVLDVWGAFADDEDKRRALAKLIWPIASWRSAFVLDTRVHPHLAWFCADYRGISTDDLAREVFKLQLAAGMPERVIDTLPHLDDGVVVGTFMTVLAAFQAIGDYTGGIEMLSRIGGAVSTKKPDYVLVHSNLAVMQMLDKHYDDAEATLDALFALDWSRFDYEPDKDDMMTGILGRDLDAEYSRAFRIYYGMAKFNAACLYAQTKRSANAIAALDEAIELNPSGYGAEKLLAEADFTPLHGTPEWTKLIGGLQ
jgi:tetratricopeptide (TPR) repeat protein